LGIKTDDSSVDGFGEREWFVACAWLSFVSAFLRLEMVETII
jgi:hypothetical protein